MRGWSVLLMVVLAGCVSGPKDVPPTGDARGDPDDPVAIPDAQGVVDAPNLTVGTAWTFEGIEQYNSDTSFQVVVAEASDAGYQFWAGAEDDLVYTALWGSAWYGEQPRAFDKWSRLRFPLSDGAAWPYSDTLTLTARAADIATPLGNDAGFVIEGANDAFSIHLEYSPRIGQIVLYQAERADGFVYDDLRMTKVEQRADPIWFELGELGVAANPHEPAVLDVPAGFDAILISAGGTTGARAHVQGPGGASWGTEFTRPDDVWQNAMLPAAEGQWIGAVASHPFLDADVPDVPADRPVGWAYMHVAPVKWIRAT